MLHITFEDLEMRSCFLKYTGKWASSTHETPYLSVVGDKLLKIIFGIWTEGVIEERNFLNEDFLS
jgi:hypothetical protein